MQKWLILNVLIIIKEIFNLKFIFNKCLIVNLKLTFYLFVKHEYNRLFKLLRTLEMQLYISSYFLAKKNIAKNVLIHNKIMISKALHYLSVRRRFYPNNEKMSYVEHFSSKKLVKNIN